jgi:hypothetical protein
MDRKFQHTVRFEAHFGNAKGTDVFLNINHHVIAVKKDQIQSIQHAYGVNSVRRHNPQAFPGTRPTPGGAQKAHEPAEVPIRHLGMGSNKPLAGLIVDTNVLASGTGWLAHRSNLAVRKF